MSGKELFIRFTASAFRKLLSIYVFSYFPFGFEGRMWDLIVSVLDHCLSFSFGYRVNTRKWKEHHRKKYSISGSSARNTCSISRISTMSSQTSRRPLTGYGTKPYGQPWGNTTSRPASYEPLKICMTRPRVQSCSTAAEKNGSELQKEFDKGVYSHQPSLLSS